MRSVRPITPLTIPFDCQFDMPGSKSEANRALVLAALAAGATRIEGATLGDDVLYMAEGLMALGFDVDIVDATKGIIEVVGGLPDIEDEAEIFCGNAGTVLRFLISVAALVPGKWILTGDSYLKNRPIGPLIQAWRSLGVQIEDCEGGLPVRIHGGRRAGGRVSLDAAKSSQFLSSLLLVGHALEGGLEVDLDGPPASADYVSLTIETMKRFGLRVSVEENRYRLTPARAQAPSTFRVEGDWSAAGAFMVLEELSASRFGAPNLKKSSLQADRRLPEFIAALREPGDLEIDASRCPDQIMNLAVLAAHRQGRTRFVGVANLRFKECDRLAVTARELRKAGVEVEEKDDGFMIEGRRKLVPCTFDPEKDHRVAMALSIIGSLAPGFDMMGRRCVAKSYPAFFEHLARAHTEHRALVLVGMRASGKSRLARELGQRLGSAVMDTDEIFEQSRGSISGFVAASGWPAFREAEEQIAAEHIRPAAVIALGGGAFESEATRELARTIGLVVHIDEDLEVIRDRVRRNPSRPALTDAGAVEELTEIHARRNPQFATEAQIRVPPGLSTEQQADLVMKELARLCSW